MAINLYYLNNATKMSWTLWGGPTIVFTKIKSSTGRYWRMRFKVNIITHLHVWCVPVCKHVCYVWYKKPQILKTLTPHSAWCFVGVWIITILHQNCISRVGKFDNLHPVFNCSCSSVKYIRSSEQFWKSTESAWTSCRGTFCSILWWCLGVI